MSPWIYNLGMIAGLGLETGGEAMTLSVVTLVRLLSTRPWVFPIMLIKLYLVDFPSTSFLGPLYQLATVLGFTRETEPEI